MKTLAFPIKNGPSWFQNGPKSPKMLQEAEHAARAQNAYFYSTAAPSQKQRDEEKRSKKTSSSLLLGVLSSR